jgi:fructose-1,6-bisphosphatase/inositol monophosphatase family enzyme
VRCRGWSDCYAYLLVATGRADAALDPVMKVWDNAALAPIVEEAGGRFSDVRGQPTIRGGSALATNGLLHGELLALLGAPPG